MLTKTNKKESMPYQVLVRSQHDLAFRTAFHVWALLPPGKSQASCTISPLPFLHLQNGGKGNLSSALPSLMRMSLSGRLCQTPGDPEKEGAVPPPPRHRFSCSLPSVALLDDMILNYLETLGWAESSCKVLYFLASEDCVTKRYAQSLSLSYGA